MSVLFADERSDEAKSGHLCVRGNSASTALAIL
jgi:hypothetical protein